MQVDVQVQNHGSLFTLTLLTPEARSFVDEYVLAPGYMFTGSRTLAVEHRYAASIVEGMQAEGLVVQ